MKSESSSSGAMLLVTAENLDPAKVTELLGLEPTQEWRKGERKVYRSATGELKQLDSIHEWGGWKLWPKEAFWDLQFEDQLRHWGDLLSSKGDQLRSLRVGGASVVLDCFLITSETVDFHVPAELQAQLATLGIDLYFAFQAHDKMANSS